MTVAGKYAYVSANDQGLKIVDINGISSPAASIGSIAANTVNVADALNVGQDIYAGGGLDVGISGIFSRGALSALGSTTLGATLAVSGSTTISAVLNSTFANNLASTTLAGNTLLTNATTTNLAITGVTSSLLKTLSNGAVVAAVAGTDYSNFAYPRSHRTQLRSNRVQRRPYRQRRDDHSATSRERFDDYLIYPQRGRLAQSQTVG